LTELNACKNRKKKYSELKYSKKSKTKYRIGPSKDSKMEENTVIKV